MNLREATRRLQAIADEHDDRADSLYRKSRRSNAVIASVDHNAAIAERTTADFLRRLADTMLDVAGKDDEPARMLVDVLSDL